MKDVKGSNLRKAVFKQREACSICPGPPARAVMPGGGGGCPTCDSFICMWANTWRKPTTASQSRLWARLCWLPVQGPCRETHEQHRFRELPNNKGKIGVSHHHLSPEKRTQYERKVIGDDRERFPQEISTLSFELFNTINPREFLKDSRVLFPYKP